MLAVDVSPAGLGWDKPAPPPLVAALGASPSCASVWQGLTTRLWRASAATSTPPALIDRTDRFNIGYDVPAAMRLTADDFLVQFQGGSIDAALFTRPHLLHYRILPGDRLERIGPLALGPRDFVEEWLTSAWPDARRWIDPRADAGERMRLQQVARHRDWLGEFDGPAKACRSDGALWQVGFTKDPATTGPSDPPSYFKVRWRAPYRFTLVATSRRPFPGCDRIATMPDDIGSLFPEKGWTPLP
jgi:hypothetical protein